MRKYLDKHCGTILLSTVLGMFGYVVVAVAFDLYLPEIVKLLIKEIPDPRYNHIMIYRNK